MADASFKLRPNSIGWVRENCLPTFIWFFYSFIASLLIIGITRAISKLLQVAREPYSSS